MTCIVTGALLESMWLIHDKQFINGIYRSNQYPQCFECASLQNICIQVQYGYRLKYPQNANTVSIYYGFIVFVVKLSILLQYLSIFVPIRKINLVFVGCHLLLGATFVFYTIVIWIEIFLCNPREKWWNPLITGGHCFSESTVNISAAAFNTLSDFLLILLPQGIIWKLKMRWQRKVGVSAIFLTGLL